MARTSRKQQKPSLSQSYSEQTTLYNVAIYARLSVEDNGKDSDSIESQIEYLEDFIANDPTMRKVAVYIDNGFTGTNFMRPEFQRMIDAARLGDINCVVVKDLSRLGRNYVETGEFLEKVCPFIGLRFIAVNDNYDSEAVTNNSQLAASLSNIINDFYAKDISRKVFSALKTKMENGEYIGAWEKYGYLKDPENKNRLIVNPETAPIVQQIFLWRSEGMSYMGINKKLNEMDIPSPGQYKADRGIVTNNNQKKRRILWNKHIVTDILKDVTTSDTWHSVKPLKFYTKVFHSVVLMRKIGLLFTTLTSLLSSRNFSIRCRKSIVRPPREPKRTAASTTTFPKKRTSTVQSSSVLIAVRELSSIALSTPRKTRYISPLIVRPTENMATQVVPVE